MGKLGKDVKNLILGNDGSDKEPVDFKTELQNAIKAGLITKADGTLLITSRTNCDKLAELISKAEGKEVARAATEDGIEFENAQEEMEYLEEKAEEKKKKEKEARKRQQEQQDRSLEQQIQASQNEMKAKMTSEQGLGKDKIIERK